VASQKLTHRQRLEACLVGEQPDRIPVALWRHFPVEDQSPARLAAATLHFQREYDFDLVKVTPTSSFCLKDWGSNDEWRGNTEGTRDYINRVISQPDDWMTLPILDPYRGHLGAQLEVLRRILSELGPDTPVIQTIFSPLAQAKNLVGGNDLLVHLRRHPAELHAGLKTIALTTQRYVEAVRSLGISGVFYAVQQAQYGMLSEAEFVEFGRRYDLEVLEPARDLWLNMLHLHGEQVMFDAVCDYPVAVINWHDRETPPSLSEAQARFGGTVCGGLRRWETLVLGTPEQVAGEAHEAIQMTGGRRLILGTGCVLPIIAPRLNLLTARQV
jgi:uroporphyrinogen decarboxylase